MYIMEKYDHLPHVPIASSLRGNRAVESQYQLRVQYGIGKRPEDGVGQSHRGGAQRL